jgi:SAM-dependent methyltransferase
MDTESAGRRLQPRITDTDWLVLRGMRPAIDRLAARVAAAGQRAVDFGCGSQPYRSIFESRGIEYSGADFAAGDVRIDASGRLALPDASVDLVLSFQVLEHVGDVGRYLGEARRVLRHAGWLLLSTHGTWLYHPHPEDHRRWTRAGLVSELSQHGFETTECIAVLGPLAWTTLVRLTCAYHVCRRIPLIGAPLAAVLAIIMNARGLLEERLTPEWVRRDNGCVYVTLSRAAGRVT